MTLEEVFYLSQSIASVAVVGTLIYLGVQVRSADRSQRALMQQGRADRTSKASLTVAHADLAHIWQIALSANPEFTPEEFAQFGLLMRATFLSGEDSFLQHQAGTLDQAAFESYAAGVEHFMAYPGVRAAWKLTRSQFGQDFRAFSDAAALRGSQKPAPDAFASWQSILRQEMGSQES